MFAALINHPDEEVTKDQAVDIDIAHLCSMLLLAHVHDAAEMRVIFGFTAESPLVKDPQESWPEWVKRVVISPYFIGRPHCGARQMRAPEA
jgi:hypothetical protein